MGRYVTKSLSPNLSSISDVDLTGLSNNDGITYDSNINKWVNDPTLEMNTNKNTSNGYLGLDGNGNVDAGTF